MERFESENSRSLDGAFHVQDEFCEQMLRHDPHAPQIQLSPEFPPNEATGPVDANEDNPPMSDMMAHEAAKLQKDRPKRPVNAFLLFSNKFRPQIIQEHIDLPNSEISKLLGERWKALPIGQRQSYIDEARVIKTAFEAAHPDYKYTKSAPKKRAKKDQQVGTDLLELADKEAAAFEAQMAQPREQEKHRQSSVYMVSGPPKMNPDIYSNRICLLPKSFPKISQPVGFRSGASYPTNHTLANGHNRHFQDVARQSMLKSTPDYSEEAIHFRWAKEADANAVAELVNTAFEIESSFLLYPTKITPEQVQQNCEVGKLLLAETISSQEVLGCVFMKNTQDNQKEKYWGLLTVAVKVQQRGLGSRLMQQVEKLSVREGCHTSQILTVNLRPQLVSWFSRHNYIIKGMKTWCEVVGNDKAVKEDVKGSILVLVMEKDLLRWSTGDTPAIL